VIWGEATIDAGKIAVKAPQTRAPKHAAGPGMCQARHIIAATDARPPALPGFEPDRKLVWTDSEAMNPDKMPRSPLVADSGASRIEFASFYRTMGADVTAVEVLPQVLPLADAEISAFVRKAFENHGIRIMTGVKVTKLDQMSDSVIATFNASGKTSSGYDR
jgi:dihydrolipoamide dehydrogenase